MPFSHAPGHGQCDFGEAVAVIVQRQLFLPVHLLVVTKCLTALLSGVGHEPVLV